MQTQSDHLLVISRHNDNLKISEHELADLKIGFKVFLNSDDPDSLTEAIQKGNKLSSVKLKYIISVIYKLFSK